MKAVRGDTWCSLHPELFGAAAGEKHGGVDALFQRILAHVNAPGVEKVLLRTPFVHGNRIFDAVQGGFGRPLKTALGEPTFLRVRSYVHNGACATPDARRAHEPMLCGEIREIVCVTMTTTNGGVGRSGSLALLRCMRRRRPNEALATAMPLPNELKLSLIHGLSLVPMLLVDRHAFKQRKKNAHEIVNGYRSLWLSSVDVTTAFQRSPHNPGVVVPTASKICPSTALFVLLEWIVGVRSPSAYPHQTYMIERMAKQSYDLEYAKAISKLSTHFQRESDHPTADDRGPPAVADAEEAKAVARMMAETTSIGFFLDLVACDTLAHLHLPMFVNPFLFPLYTSICVVLAATPSLNCQWVPNAQHAEENQAIARVFEAYRAMNAGAPTTILETLVEVAAEQLKPSTKNDGRPRTGARPLSAEHMRRQGVALCHELAATLHADCVAHAHDVDSKFCEDASMWAEACGVLTPSCLIESAKLDRKVHGVCGSWRQVAVGETRCATRAARLRSLLQIMSDVNEVLETGIFRMRREYSENTGEAARRHSGQNPPFGRVNTEAWEDSLEAALSYLTIGPGSLCDAAAFELYPLTHRTRAACARCRDKFDVSNCMPKGKFAQCVRCHAFVCSPCYDEYAKSQASGSPAESICRVCSGVGK